MAVEQKPRVVDKRYTVRPRALACSAFAALPFGVLLHEGSLLLALIAARHLVGLVQLNELVELVELVVG